MPIRSKPVLVIVWALIGYTVCACSWLRVTICCLRPPLARLNLFFIPHEPCSLHGRVILRLSNRCPMTFFFFLSLVPHAHLFSLSILGFPHFLKNLFSSLTQSLFKPAIFSSSTNPRGRRWYNNKHTEGTSSNVTHPLLWFATVNQDCRDIYGKVLVWWCLGNFFTRGQSPPCRCWIACTCCLLSLSFPLWFWITLF